jgi:hypothetical protein
MNGPPAFSIQLTAPTATSGTLEVPATGYSQAFSLSAGEVASVDLPDAIWYPEGSESVGIFGVRIRSEDPIEAVAFHWRLYFSEASRLLPREELGTDYHVLTVQDLNDGPTGFTVVATQDGTEVEVTPSAFTLGLRPENTPYIITLNEGEVWPVQANADLSGSRVRSLSGQPIAVFAGARQPIVGCGRGATSHVWEQLPPIDRWGRHTIVVPYARKSADTVRILADEDGTEVRLDCADPITLDAGEVLELEVDAPLEIIASAPVLVAQVMQGGDCGGEGSGDPDSPGSSTAIGDPSLAYVPPPPLPRTEAIVQIPLETDSLAAASRHVSAIGSDAPPLVSGARTEEAGTTTTATFDGPSATVSGSAFSGLVHAIGSYDALTWTLGYDCRGCVAALQDAPSCE